MNLHLHRLSLIVFLISLPAWCMHHSDDLSIKMGPLLHFEAQNLETGTWEISALYVLKHRAIHPDLEFSEGSARAKARAYTIGTKFGYDFVRYDVAIVQTTEQRFIDYQLPGETSVHRFVTPALKQPHSILYHSCNGYQRDKDRKKAGGISPMWAEIKHQHEQRSYHLQIGGGDQIYADGVIAGICSTEPHHDHTYGVFALDILQSWIKNTHEQGIAPFSTQMAHDVDRFFFEHYMRHYNLSEFADVNARIPIISVYDDHDIYDGCGSYPELLQSSFVMKGIRTIGLWYVFAVQHQLNPNLFMRKGEDPKPYHFLKVINDGTIAILGVDTRTRRTQQQVVAPEDWDKLFLDLKTLSSDVEHLIVLLGIPIVYASSANLDRVLTTVEHMPIAQHLLPHVPGLHTIFEKNAFKLFEIADDLHDGWSHPDHQDEANLLISRLQEHARNTNSRVTILSGDVHAGGVGLISRGDYMAVDAIVQLISSPVGNVTPKRQTVHFLSKKGRREQKIGDNATMSLVDLIRADGHAKKHALIAHRNFLSLMRMPSGDLQATWSAERTDRSRPHKYYHYTVPRPPRSMY